MSETDFAPGELTEEASLNRTVLARLPGARPELVGRRAYDVVTSADASLLAPGMGHLIATLRQGPGSECSAWRAAYLQHWAQLGRIWLGGGRVAAFGAGFVQTVQAEARRLGVTDCEIRGAPHADVLALLGAARSRATAAECAIVLDCGHTAIKRGICFGRGGRLVRLEVLMPLAAPALEAAADEDAATARLVGAVVDAIAVTWWEAAQRGHGPDRLVVVSLASYVRHGRPVSSRGVYGRLGQVSAERLEAMLRDRTGETVRLSFVHDGTAAARGLPDAGQAGAAGAADEAGGVGAVGRAGEARSAGEAARAGKTGRAGKAGDAADARDAGVIVVGTSLAAGCVDVTRRWAAVAADFRVVRPSGQAG